MDNPLKENLRELKLICKKFNVKELFVFGSMVNGHYSPESDIDFLVSFKETPLENYADQYFEMLYALEDLFQRKIDLVTIDSLSNPYFIESVNKNKELIYAA
ncbi:MAG: nucleotidyltransferase family protein [bacterium]